ncbi:MAG TPA: Calx-beta domain-containing protein [Pyrinomonadaceae bacterium]|nr:Calx-beta domain-containing protein [Pyrinomonadaceae bacterium]
MFKNRNLTRIAVISTVLIALTAVTATAAIGIPGFSIFDTITTFFGGTETVPERIGAPEPMTIGFCDTASPIEVEASLSGFGPTGYASLGAAFTAINGGAHTGAISIEVCGNTSEPGTATLNASGAGSASYSFILIRPVGGVARTITGSPSGGSPLVYLNGADNVTINGINSGGDTLTISNTTVSATANTATILFVEGASGNTITNSNIQGSFTGGTAVAGGVIHFSTDGVAGTGNDNNTISNNSIGPAGANLPTTGIYGLGTTSSTALNNSGIQISGNKIFDFFGAAVADSGIYVSSGNTDWTISGNSFYQTATRTMTTAAVDTGIQISNTSGNNFAISNNFIGGSTVTAGGTAWTIAGSIANRFRGISLNVGSTTASSVQGNTIANFAFTSNSSATTVGGPWSGIYLGAGNANIGTVSGNTIGAATGNGSINISVLTNSGSISSGIFSDASPTTTSISNNNIGSISFGASTISQGFQGIATTTASSGAMTISGNTIGSTTTANSININTGATSTTNQIFRGINNTISTVAVSITGNTIANVLNNYLPSSATSTNNILVGITSTAGINTITGNTVRNMTTSANHTGTGSAAPVIGILQTGSTAGQTVGQNTIHSLSEAHATAAVNVYGFYLANSSNSGTNIIERNFIHSLSAVSSGAGIVRGIYTFNGGALYRNNMIRLGIDSAGASLTSASITIDGILSDTVSSASNNWYYNSIYVGGSGVATGSASTAGFRRTTSDATDFRNNIVVNSRFNGTGTGKHYGMALISGATTFTADKNLYYVNGSGPFGVVTSTDAALFSNWKTNTSQDTNSVFNDPLFLASTGTSATVDLHIAAGSPARDIAGIPAVSTDIDGQTRPGVNATYDVGADEADGITPAANDIAATAFIDPTSGATKLTAGFAPQASFTNNGTAAQTNVPVRYRICADAGCTSVLYNQTATIASLASGATATVTFPSTGAIIAGTHTTKAKAELVGDTVSGNDEIGGTVVVKAPLAGDYTVGSGGNYSTLTAAVAELNSVGVSAAVRFLLTDATYSGSETFPITIGVFPGASAANTVTIRPNTGVTSTISGANTIFKLNGADYVIIDGSNSGGTDRSLTISNTAATGGPLFVASLGTGQGATNDTIKNCIIKSGNIGTTSNFTYGIFVGDTTGAAAGADNDNLTITNNQILQARTGIQMVGVAATGLNDNASITNNLIGDNTLANSIGRVGILLQVLNNSTISGNTVKNVFLTSDTSSTVGLSIDTLTNSTVSQNTVTGLQTNATSSSVPPIGISIGTTSTGNTISQNTIDGVTGGLAGTGSGDVYGFFIGSLTSSTVSRNNVTNITYNGTGGYGGRGIYISTSSTTSSLTFANNTISNIKGDGWNSFTSDSIAGVMVAGTTGGVNFYNNSVNLGSGSFAGNSSGTLSAAMYVGSSVTALDLRNNIFATNLVNSNAASAKTYAIYSAAANTAFANINYNDYYTSGAQGVLGFLTSDRTNLAGVVSGFGGNANSKNVDPSFISSTDLHLLSGSGVRNFGFALGSPYNIDYDGDARPLESAYEIGADEYVDGIEPTTTIDTGAPGTPTNPTTSTSATFTFSGTDNLVNPDAPQAVASFECALDTVTFTACTSPQSYGPGLSIGSHNFKVRTVDAAGNRDASPAEFAWSIVAPAPTITSLNPASGWTDTTVIIVGTNFTGATAVSFGGTPATFFTVPNDGFISATAPAHAAGVVDVTVTGPGGTSANTSADDFTYITPDAAPEVNFTNPANGATGVSITQPVGVGFSENVSLAANAITLECPSGNVILQYPSSPMASVAGVTFYPTMPATTTCTVTVDASKVNDVDANDPPDFMAANYAFSFTTATPPTVTALNPPSGSTVGGNIVTIDGTNFTGVTDVTFDGVTAAFTFVSATKMSATAPAHAAGAVDVRVTTPGGTSATNANAVYTYVAPGDHFRSRVSGDWGTPGTWESSPDGNAPWTPATSSPDSSSLSISIQSGHTVTVTAAANGDQMTCAGTLIVNDGVTFTLNNDIGTDFGLTGTLNAIGTGVISGAGQFVMSSGSSLGIGSPAGITAAGATGSIQTAGRTFDSGANYSYIGSVAQVTGSGLPGANSLTINNSSGVTLSGPTGVSTLALTNGKVTTTAGNILSVGNPAVGAISGGSSTSYVNGPLLRVIPSNLGAGSVYVFPVGKGGYNPLEMVDTITGLSDVFVIVEEFDATANPIAGLGLSTVNTDRYWKTELLFGSQNFTSTKIRLTNSSPLTVDSRVAKGSAPSTVFNSVGGAFAGSTVLSDPVTSTGYFAIGTATPTVTTTGSLTGFGPVTVGNTSPAQSYSVSGFFLTGNLTVTAPTGFEVSQSQFSGFTNTFDLVPASGVVNSTTVWVRFAPASAITYSDNVTNASTGATTQNVAVTGTGVAPTTVLSLTRAHPNPTNLNDVMWTIEFAAPVSGVATGNFALVNGGLTTPSITSVNPQGTAPNTKWNISVNTGSGSGTLGLNFVNATGLTPGVSTTLPVTGDEYIIDKSAPETTIESGPPLTTTSTDATFVFGANDNMLAEAQLAILHSFVCELDGVVIDLGCTSAKSYTGLSIGSHTFKVRATDRAGNTDPSDATYTWLIVPPPTLGNYDDKTVAFAGNTTVTPSAPPANATNLVVSASTGYAGAFAGGLTINQTTGVVTVTDAHPAGTYTVTVNAFGPGSVATDTFVLTVSPGATCGQSSFDPAVNYTAGTNPNKVVTNDVNLDGKPDMVVANGVSNNVSVRLGNGSGGFGAVANFAVGDHPNSIAVADLNLDGNPDIATANDLSTNLSILLGNGSGGFSAATSVSTGNNPFGVVTADFNFDGKPDLAAANSTDGNVSVFLGDGAGGFGAATNFGVGTNPIEVAVGDFNNDGKADLVTANNGSNNVSVLIGNGLGGFAAAANFSVGTLPQSLAVGDLNHDGKLDIVVTTTAALGASVLIGDGTGSFAAATSTDVGTNPTGVAISDVNLDGHPDLVVTNFAVPAPNVSVTLGDGTGVYATPAAFGAGDNTRSVAAGDFNLDGKPDLAVANSGSANVSVLLNVCVAPVVDLTILKSDGGATVAAGGTVAYTLNYANNGTTPATGVVLTETVPAHSSFNAGVSTAGWVCTPNNNAGSTCTLAVGSLAFGGSGSAVFAVDVETPILGGATQIDNTASIADDGTHGADVNLTNNTSSDSTPLNIPISFAIGDVTANEGDAGSTLFTFTITKTGLNGQPTTITLQTCDVSATAPGDYTSLGSCIVAVRPSGAESTLVGGDTVTFAPTDTSKEVTVLVVGDTVVEPDETFTLKMVTSTNGTFTDDEGLGTIVNDDSVCAPPPPNMTAWYDGSGAAPTANDIGGSNNGTLQSGAVFAPGKVGQAFALNGGASVVDVPRSASLESGFVSVDAWVRPDSVGTTYNIVTKNNTSAIRPNYGLELRADGRFNFYASSANGNFRARQSNTLAVAGTWYHVAGTWDGTEARLYINGVDEAGPADAGGLTGPIDHTNGANLTIGAHGFGSPLPAIDGVVDEVEIFSRALDPGEIAAIANAGSAGKCHTSTVRFAQATDSVTEDGAVTFTAIRDGANDSAVTVNYLFNNGGTDTATGGAACGGAVDYVNGNDQFSFGVGVSSIPFAVDTCPDAAIEGNETFSLTLANPSSGLSIVAPATETVTIVDDDFAPTQDTDVTLSGSALTIEDVNGANTNDDLRLSCNGANLRINDPTHLLYAGAGTQIDPNTVEVSIASITSIVVNSLAGDDALTINLSGCDIVPSGGITYNGGDPTSGTGDRLNIVGGNQGQVTYHYNNASDGNVQMQNFGTVNYTGLEPISNTGTASDVIFELPTGANAATLGDDGTGGNGMSRLSGATFEDTDFANPTSSVTIKRGDAADTLAVNALPDLNSSINIGTSVDTFSTIAFNGAVTLASGNSLAGFAAGTISFPNGTSDIATSGAGTIALTTATNVSMLSGSSLTTVDGALTINANQQVTPTAGNFNGINIDAATVQSTGSGVVTVNGKGGTVGGGQHGVLVISGGLIRGGNAAGITTNVNGTGGAATGVSNIGVIVIDGGASITSNGGNVSVIGTGGSGAGGDHHGVRVFNAVSAASISAGSSGTVTVSGTGGSAAAGGCFGVDVRTAGAAITSNGGAVTINGQGGACAQNVGVVVTGASIQSGTNGPVSVTGTGGTSAGTNNDGLNMNGGNISATGTGTVTIDGTATFGTSSEGIDLSGGSPSITTALNSAITMIGDSMNLGAGSINSGTGPVTIRQKTAIVAINLGTSGDPLGGPLNLLDAEIDRVTAGTLFVGNSNSGTITTSAAITHPNNLTLTTGRGITFTSPVTMAVDKTLTGNAEGTATGAISVNAALGSTGTGGVALTTARNIAITQGISTVNGPITLNANQTNTGTGAFFGVNIDGAAAIVQASGSGVVTINGRGGNSGNSIGIGMANSSVVKGGSTFGVTTTSLTGTGGSGNNTHGLQIGAGASISSFGGNISVIGTAGAGDSAGQNIGFILYPTGTISSTVNGSVTVAGTGGTGGNLNEGIRIDGSLSKISAAGSGNVTVTATAGANSSNGLDLSRSGSIGTASGTIQITGTHGSTGGTGIWLNPGSSGNPIISSTNATITLIADRMDFAAGSVSANAGIVNIRQKTNNQQINLGGADSAVQLGLIDVELDRVTAGTMNIGDAFTGAVSVSNAITQTKLTNIFSTSTTVLTGGDLGIFGTVNSTLAANSGGTIRPGASPGVINSGDLNLASGSTYPVEIGGTIPGNGAGRHDQLNVTGTVALGGNLTLAQSGGFNPANGNTFVIINNDLGDLVSGTFNGLPEGATIPNFIGTGRDAKISYVGGDGNDVVLTAQAAPGTLQFASATYSGVENGGSIALSVTRTGGTEGAVSADYTLAGGSATGGAVCGGAVDYINTGGTVSFTAGSSTPQTINVQICPDATLEPDELFTVTLSNGNIGTPAAANVTILNDDCTPMPANMLSWYSGDGNANDIVGTNTGTWTGTAKYATGKVAQAFDFDGTNRVSASGSGSLNITGAQMTMDGWVYPRSGANAYYFGRTAPSDHPYVLMTISGNLVVIISTATDNQQFDTGFTMPVNAWTHIAMTYDAGGVGDKLRVYANGTQVFSAPTTGGNLRSSTLPLTIGGRTAGDNPFNGLIDEVEVFDRALDATAIAALASASGGGKCHTSTVQFSTNAYSVTEGNVNAPITVTRVGAHDTAATFNFATSGGTATAGAAADYDDVNLTGVTFAVGEVSKVVNIPIHDDNIYEVAETVNIAVSNIATAPATTPGTPLSAVLTINPDGDTPPVLNVADATFAGDSLVAGTCSNAFEISLVGATQVFPVTVHYQTSNDTATAGQDYTATSGTLTFNNSMPQCIPVTILEDPVNEPTEQFFIDLDTPTNATIGDGHGIGTIPSGDPLSFTIGDVTQVETNSGTTNFVFYVAKVGTTSQPSQVTISTVNGSAVGGASCGAGVDFVSQSGSVLNFLATDASLPFTVTVCGDTDFEGDEAFTLSATATVGASATTVAGTKTGTILNDDCTPPPAGMASWFDGSGTAPNAVDIVGPNNGTLQGGAAFGTGKVGQGFVLNGTSAYVSVPDNTANSPTNAITVDAWIKPDAVNGLRTVASKYDSSTNQIAWEFGVRDGRLELLVQQAGLLTSPYRYSRSDIAVVPVGTYSHVAATFDINGQAIHLFVNGTEVTSTLDPGSSVLTSINDSNAPMFIGAIRDISQVSSFFSGDVDEVEIFGQALTQPQIAAIALASGGGKCHTPIVQFARSAEMEDESQTANVIVRRNVSVAGTTNVTAATVAGGTATGGAACTAGVDYKTTSQLLSFDNGDVEQSMSIEICPDLEYETPQTIKLQLSGPSGAAVLGGNSEIFLTINDTATQFTNNHDPINIPAFGATASPYPSTINVTGAPTVNGGMRVTLYDVELANPDNLDILLVGPLGQKMVIMGDAGGSTAMSGPVTLTFDDAAGQVLPNAGPLTTGKFEPTTWEPVIAAFPAPAPVFPYVIPGSALGGPPSLGLGFGAGNPNGQWRLFVRDDAGAAFTEAGQPGAIAGGWGLQFVVPTAAGVSVSGRVTTAEGRGIRGAVVTITGNSLATPINVTTGVNGRYIVEGLTAGETYIVTIRSRRFVFTNSSRIVTLNDNVGDADFIADPGTTRGDQ